MRLYALTLLTCRKAKRYMGWQNSSVALKGENMPIDKVLGYEYICKNNKKYYVHRLVMEKYLGRQLNRGEQTHHVDGNKLNNNIENLQIVSASEHAKIEAVVKGWELREDQYCISCGKKCCDKNGSITGMCQDCSHISKRKFDPSKEELEIKVWSSSMVDVAKYYNVSDKAIAKRCKLLKIEIPPIGYWLRRENK